MKPQIKPVLYVVLGILALWMAWGFYRNWKSSNEAVSERPADTTEVEPARRSHNTGAQGRMMAYAFGLIACAIGLGFVVSHDVSNWFANRSHDFITNDHVDGFRDPDYDHAEQVALKGDFMEALELLRAFLKRNPREIYAAIRIAEIYEKDLQNPLAAALEYEEVLKHKFNPDRWGWVGIHLANLYSGKLNQTSQAMEWLKKIESEYPDSAPARKARERLGLPEGGTAAATPIEEESPSPAPPSNLPPGFSPKKR